VTAIPSPPAPSPGASVRLLNGAAGFWWLTAILGQWAFLYYILSFYGASSLSGDFEIWNRLKVMGRTPYVAGDTAGNLAFLAHALAAGIIAFGGALQLVPGIRARFPAFHRWNGRLFLLTVTGLSLSGFYLVWVRGTSPDSLNALSTTINGVLILAFAALALRAAMARNITVHRRWAMRLYLVSNAQWFLRVGVFAYFVVNMGLGNKVKFSDPFLSFWVFGCYLVPIAVLEVYLRAKDRAGPAGRTVVAIGLIGLTLLMAAGALAFSAFSLKIASGAPLDFPG
jgi:hypothetical protein